VHSATRPKDFPTAFGTPGRGLALGFSPVFLLDAMVQIIEHRDLSPEDFLMEEGVASSMPRGSNRHAPGAVESEREGENKSTKGIERMTR
jgi:hypothetical protein